MQPAARPARQGSRSTELSPRGLQGRPSGGGADDGGASAAKVHLGRHVGGRRPGRGAAWVALRAVSSDASCLWWFRSTRRLGDSETLMRMNQAPGRQSGVNGRLKVSWAERVAIRAQPPSLSGFVGSAGGRAWMVWQLYPDPKEHHGPRVRHGISGLRVLVQGRVCGCSIRTLTSIDQGSNAVSTEVLKPPRSGYPAPPRFRLGSS